ncbi:branched-chain-amino-acid transaminase [soil metagenome]
MSLKIWLDGQLVDQANAKISVYDHGLLYGDGVFEGIRVYHGKLFEIQTHLRRLYDSAKAIRLSIPITQEEMKAAIVQTYRANNFDDCYVRVVVTRGVGDLGINPKNSKLPSVFIIADLIAVYPREMYEKGMAVITASYIRNHPNAQSPRIKSLNYLNNILAKIEANDAGVPEAVMLNHDGNVAECTADNIFIVRDSQVQTPNVTDGILEGVTRGVIMKLCKTNKIDCVERTLQRHDLYVADEIFVTGTGAEVMPVTKVDGRVIGTGEPGTLTRKLIDLFKQYVRG